jgi:hypothetical protein
LELAELEKYEGRAERKLLEEFEVHSEVPILDQADALMELDLAVKRVAQEDLLTKDDEKTWLDTWIREDLQKQDADHMRPYLDRAMQEQLRRRYEAKSDHERAAAFMRYSPEARLLQDGTGADNSFPEFGNDESILPSDTQKTTGAFRSLQSYGDEPATALHGDLRAFAASNQMTRIAMLEIDEIPLVESARFREDQKLVDYEDADLARAKQASQYWAMGNTTAAINAVAADAALQEAQLEYDLHARRNISQIITKVAVTRDLIIRQLITTLVSNEQPLRFNTPTFNLWVGKSTDLSSIHPSFKFPPKFTVPPDSPDVPTPDNPVTGFGFEYLEYKSNIYDWANSAPESDQSFDHAAGVYRQRGGSSFGRRTGADHGFRGYFYLQFRCLLVLG